jgi:hypothetical protein
MPRAKSFRYQNRVTAFIDILGLSDHLLNRNGKKFAKNIASIVTELLSKDGKLNVKLPHIKLSYSVKAAFPGWHEDRNDVDCLISSISDSIVISVPEFVTRREERQHPLFSTLVCMEMVFHLQRNLLQLGVLTRGAISFGRLHHANNIVIGDALVSAYRLESQSAIFPRVILAPEIQKLLLGKHSPPLKFGFERERIAQMFTRDADGMYFIDYLGIDPYNMERDWKKRLAKIEKFISYELRTERDLRIGQKLNWLQSYIAISQRYLKQRKVPPHRTTGPLENAFPRILAKSPRAVRAHVKNLFNALTRFKSRR